MKRTPLNRKTPLKAKTGLKRSGPIQRRTRINQVSKKRSALNRKRRTFVEEQLGLRPLCEAGPIIMRAGHQPKCQRVSMEIHEPVLRSSGGSITSVENSISICRLCHRWVHDNVRSALELGLIKKAESP